jgi:hypothetical protein
MVAPSGWRNGLPCALRPRNEARVQEPPEPPEPPLIGDGEHRRRALPPGDKVRSATPERSRHAFGRDNCSERRGNGR